MTAVQRHKQLINHAMSTIDSVAHLNSVESSSITCNTLSGIGQNHTHTRLIDRIHRRQASGNKFFSFEFFPPKTASGTINLFSRQVRRSWSWLWQRAEGGGHVRGKEKYLLNYLPSALGLICPSLHMHSCVHAKDSTLHKISQYKCKKFT